MTVDAVDGTAAVVGTKVVVVAVVLVDSTVVAAAFADSGAAVDTVETEAAVGRTEGVAVLAVDLGTGCYSNPVAVEAGKKGKGMRSWCSTVRSLL